MRQSTIPVYNKSKDLPLPKYETPDSAGVDVSAYISEEIILAPSKSVLIPTGLHVAIPTGFEIQIRPRSGLANKKVITVLNSPGTIDSDYRGDMGVILINHSEEEFIIKPGMRIGQLVLSPVYQIIWKPVDSIEALGTTVRGQGGFGHTGD